MRPHVTKQGKNYHDVLKWFILTFSLCSVIELAYLLILVTGCAR